MRGQSVARVTDEGQSVARVTDEGQSVALVLRKYLEV